jgi:hypothetical protein
MGPEYDTLLPNILFLRLGRTAETFPGALLTAMGEGLTC